MAYWTPKDYTPFFLFDEPTHTDKEVRAEYSRLRDILHKRSKRLREAGFIAQADYIDARIPKLSEIYGAGGRHTTGIAVRQHLSFAHSLYIDPIYTMQGIRKLWKEYRENVDEGMPLREVLGFHEYMKSWRTSAYRYLVTTNEAVELYYNEYQEIGGSFDTFYTIYKMEQRNQR